MDDSGLDALARSIADQVPALADWLLATRPGRVHREAMARVERPLLAHVLAVTGGNQLRAARLLGLNRNTLRKRCRALGVAAPRPARTRREAPPLASAR